MYNKYINRVSQSLINENVKIKGEENNTYPPLVLLEEKMKLWNNI